MSEEAGMQPDPNVQDTPIPQSLERTEQKNPSQTTVSTPPSGQARHHLFRHTPHPHKPQNVNLIFEAEKAAGNFNQQVAVGMTKVFQAMPTFWLIMAWIILWIAANATIVRFDPLPWPLLLALASVPQLPLMIVIMVGQGLLGRQQELQSSEQFNTTMKTYHDIEQIMAHLSAQDEELLKQTHMIIHLLRASGISEDQIVAAQQATNKDATSQDGHNIASTGQAGTS